MKASTSVVRTLLTAILLSTLLVHPRTISAQCDGCGGGGGGLASKEKMVKVDYSYGAATYLRAILDVNITKKYKGVVTVLVDDTFEIGVGTGEPPTTAGQ
jgi:hypothetical protein